MLIFPHETFSRAVHDIKITFQHKANTLEALKYIALQIVNVATFILLTLVYENKGFKKCFDRKTTRREVSEEDEEEK
jgi:hypothetical protein